MTKSVLYRESLMRALSDPVEASAYLNSALGDSQRAFLKALKNVAQARQMSRIAKDQASSARLSIARSPRRETRPLKPCRPSSAHWG